MTGPASDPAPGVPETPAAEEEEEELVELKLGQRRGEASDSEGDSDHEGDQEEADEFESAGQGEESSIGAAAAASAASPARSDAGGGADEEASGAASGEGEDDEEPTEEPPQPEPRRPLQPYDVPTSGRFWLHDDRNEQPAPEPQQPRCVGWVCGRRRRACRPGGPDAMETCWPFPRPLCLSGARAHRALAALHSLLQAAPRGPPPGACSAVVPIAARA